MINLRWPYLIFLGIMALVVVIALDVLIGTTVIPRLIPTPTPTMPPPEILQFELISPGPPQVVDTDATAPHVYVVYRNTDVTFQWWTQHAARVTFGVNGDTPEAVSPNGLKHVWTITQDNTYILEAVNATDSVSETIQLQVIPVHFVRPSATGSGDCSSWTNACALPTALDKAQPGDEIWVEKGVHKPGTNRSDTFELSNDVALYGGFLGIETSRDQRDWKHNITILSGDIDGNDITANGVITTTTHINGTNSFHVVTGSGTDDTAILDGFTITGGQANGTLSEPCGHACGGGMFNDGGSPTLANVTFGGNFAAQAGGGIWNYNNSSPNLTNVSFIGNTATRDGGGMGNDTMSNPTLSVITFTHNIAEAGGGMYNDDSNPRLTSTEFISNTATSADGDAFGGGMYNIDSSPTLTNTNFISNTATTIPPQAAQRYAFGGGMHNRGNSSPTLTNANFISNTAKQDGGGMYNLDNSSPTLTNVIFKGNKAKFGGGLYNRGSSGPTLTNLTFYGNIAEGGGIYNFYNGRPITLTNCIVWGNKDSIINVASTTNFFYSLVEGGCGDTSTICDTHIIDKDPMFVKTDEGDLHLQAGSPAIDSGTNDRAPNYDLDQNPRPVDGNGDGTAITDMGAYEYLPK